MCILKSTLCIWLASKRFLIVIICCQLFDYCIYRSMICSFYLFFQFDKQPFSRFLHIRAKDQQLLSVLFVAFSCMLSFMMSWQADKRRYIFITLFLVFSLHLFSFYIFSQIEFTSLPPSHNLKNCFYASEQTLLLIRTRTQEIIMTQDISLSQLHDQRNQTKKDQ